MLNGRIALSAAPAIGPDGWWFRVWTALSAGVMSYPSRSAGPRASAAGGARQRAERVGEAPHRGVDLVRAGAGEAEHQAAAGRRADVMA